MSHTNSKCKQQGFYIYASNIVAVVKPTTNERHTYQWVFAHTNKSTAVVDNKDDEDLDILTKAAEIDSFSYTMGEDLLGMEAPEAPLDGDLDGVRVTVWGKPQQNLVHQLLLWLRTSLMWFVGESYAYLDSTARWIFGRVLVTRGKGCWWTSLMLSVWQYAGFLSMLWAGMSWNKDDMQEMLFKGLCLAAFTLDWVTFAMTGRVTTAYHVWFFRTGMEPFSSPLHCRR